VSAIFVYELRVLLRTAVMDLIDGNKESIQPHHQLQSLIKSISEEKSSSKVALIGIGGAGNTLFDLLKSVRYLKTQKVKTIVWVSASAVWMKPLLTALHVDVVLCENTLNETLQPALSNLLSGKATSLISPKSFAPTRRITMTELDILLQFASGLTSREMSERRGCNLKTIFSWKHNICEALSLTTHAQWLEMLAELAQLSSIYRQG
jgi:DNA-binding CsgD family transcriptional regulator